MKLGVKKLGIASCIGLLDEASIYAKIVRTAGIETKTVICKVGAIDKTEIGLPDQLKVCPGCNESCCNPALQAQVLNDWGADLNVLVGLCVGHDAIFTRHSKAPAVTVHRQGPGTGPQSGSGDLHLKILLQTGSERNNVPGTENAFQAEKLTGRRSGETGDVRKIPPAATPQPYGEPVY